MQAPSSTAGRGRTARGSAPRARLSGARHLRAYLYLSPALAFMAFATFVPVAYTIFIAFTNYSLYHFTHFEFVGWKNFADIFGGFDLDTFLMVFEWTVIFAVLTTAINFSAGMTLAYLLNNPNMVERSIYRTLLIIPWALPGTITLLAWSGILNPDFGYLNTLLKDLHLAPVPWLSDAVWAKVSILLVNLWLSFPFMMTACLGALQGIPAELTDAAEIDGAGPLAKFWLVVVPAIRTTMLPLLINGFAFQFNNFNVIYLLTAGGPPTSASSFAGATDILASYTYGLTLTYQRYGLAAAYAIIIFLIIGTLSTIQMKLSGAFEELD
jgi:arabinogalactan oligomer/maltooligosaccharide transport system permease protein